MRPDLCFQGLSGSHFTEAPSKNSCGGGMHCIATTTAPSGAAVDWDVCSASGPRRTSHVSLSVADVVSHSTLPTYVAAKGLMTLELRHGSLRNPPFSIFHLIAALPDLGSLPTACREESIAPCGIRHFLFSFVFFALLDFISFYFFRKDLCRLSSVWCLRISGARHQLTYLRVRLTLSLSPGSLLIWTTSCPHAPHDSLRNSLQHLHSPPFPFLPYVCVCCLFRISDATTTPLPFSPPQRA